MDKKVYYEVGVGGMYLKPMKFDTYEEAKAEYDDIKTYEHDSYVSLAKVTKEYLESEYLPEREDED